MYVSVVFFGCVGVLIALQNVVSSLFFFGFAFLMLITALAFSPSVEVSAKGIRASGMFSSTAIQWEEIAKVKSNNMKRRLELSKKNGEMVNVSTQVSGYPQIVEIIRTKRPDLFGMGSKPQTQTSAFSSTYDNERMEDHGSVNPAQSFSGKRIFKKSFLANYGVLLLMLPICLVGGWFAITASTNENRFAGIGVILVGLFFMGASLFNINRVKLEGNKLTTETFFGEKEYTAKQIKAINMKTVRSRRGVASNFINVQPVKGSAISLAGFVEGDEILYGILMNWWSSYRSG